MKILYLFRSLAIWGGIERVLVEKMNYLSMECGYEIHMITTDQCAHPFPYDVNNRVYLEDLNIGFYRQYNYHGLKRLIVLCKMVRQYESLLSDRIKRINPDIIVCTTSDRIGSIAKLKAKIPMVVESHSICQTTINYGRNWLHRSFRKYFLLKDLSKVDGLIALTEGDAKEWRNYLPNVKTIPDVITSNWKRASSLSSKRVIFVGRFDYQKRVQDAIDIWRIVEKRHSDWILDIYGDGDMRNEILKIVEDVGSIYLHAPTKDIFNCYLNSSILIMTSLFEPFGLVLAEAMSCGVPVVAYDCPYGPSEIITNGVDGFVIKKRNAEEFADRVCQLIENDDLRMDMGAAAYISSQRYRAEYIMPQWEKFYKDIVVL